MARSRAESESSSGARHERGVDAAADAEPIRAAGIAALKPTTLLAMHRSAFTGDGGRVLRGMPDGFESSANAA